MRRWESNPRSQAYETWLNTHSPRNIFGGPLGIRTLLLSSVQEKWPPQAVPQPNLFMVQVEGLEPSLSPPQTEWLTN